MSREIRPEIIIKSNPRGPQGPAGGLQAPGTTVVGNIPTFADITGQAVQDSGKKISTDTTMSGNSDNNIPTERVVKSYADALIGANDAMVFKGVIDCSANPDYPIANAGYTYKISVAGLIGGASGVSVEAGDMIICIQDGTVSGNQATVGAYWNILQQNINPYSTFSYNPAGAGTTTVDISKAKTSIVTMPAATQTLAISNAIVGQYFVIEIINTTAQGALTWFSTIKWVQGAVPVLTGVNGKKDTFGFRVTSAGNYDGYVIGQNI